MMSNQLKCNIVIAAKKKKTLASGHKKSKITKEIKKYTLASYKLNTNLFTTLFMTGAP